MVDYICGKGHYRGFKVSQEVGNGRQFIRESEKVGVGDRVFEAKKTSGKL